MSIEDPNAYPVGPPVKRGMSTAAKVLLILGCLVGLGVLGCCGVSFYFGYKMKDAFTQDPVKIRERTQAIVEISIPEVLIPDRAMELLGIMQLVGYGAKGDQAYGHLIMVEMSKTLVPNEQQARVQLSGQAEQQMQQLAGSKRASGIPKPRDPIKVNIRGKDVHFDIADYPGSNGGPEMIKVSGLFEGKKGYCQLLMEVSRPLLTDQQIETMLKSIK